MIRDKPLHNFLFETDETGFYDNLDTWCMPWIDLCCLLHLVRKKKPKSFLEIGTHRGFTTRALLDRFHDMYVVTVDPGDKIPHDQRPRNQLGEFLPQGRVGELVKGRKNVEIIHETFESIDWGKRQFDMIFVDGNHTYSHVLHNSQTAMRILAPNGTIVWHDFGNVPDVSRALAELNTKCDIATIHNTWIAYLET